MQRKSTTDALFASSVLMEKYREGQKEFRFVFVDLEKAYDKRRGMVLHEKVGSDSEVGLHDNSTSYV